MIVEVKINELPESVEDGTIVLWHKNPGDEVKADEPLADLETDKVVLEIAAPSAGVLSAQLRKKGESVKRGDVIATIDSATAPAARPAGPKPASKSSPAPAAKAPTPVAQPAPSAKPKTTTAPAAPPPVAQVSPPLPPPAVPTVDGKEDEPHDGLAPAVRRLLQEHQLVPADITGTGPRGRISKEDVIRHLEHSPQLASKFGEAPAVVEISEATAPSAEETLAERPATRVKMSRLRARIAERM
ncbi:MAG TPA: biotin/lipoyl-containing protein, partial [Polyangia bacterium]